MAKGAWRSPSPPRHPRVTSDARRSTPPPAPLSDARARGKLTPALPSRLARSTHRGCEGQGREGREGCEKGGFQGEALEEALLPHLPQVRVFPSVASTGPPASATRGHARKITKRDAIAHRAPKTLRRPLTPASSHLHHLRPKTFKASRAPKYPRVSVPPMCKLDQFQVRSARLPARSPDRFSKTF